jgi:PAS domain S-box-containing protein
VRDGNYSSEETRKESIKRYLNLFENTLIGIVHTSLEGRFLRANPAAAHIFGYASPQDLLSNVQEIGSQLYISPGDRVKFIDEIQNQDSWVVREQEYRRRGGSTFFAKVSSRKVLNSDGTIAYYETFIEDITERKQVESKLEQYRLNLEKMIAERTSALVETTGVWKPKSASGRGLKRHCGRVKPGIVR